MIVRSDQVAARLHGLSLRQLRCFVTVARHNGFSRAAVELSVSQPALSATIRQLEQRLEIPLFHRTTHNVALTEHGHAVLPHAERLLITADHAFADMHAAVTREQVTIRIGVMPSAMAMVAHAIAAFGAPDGRCAAHISDGRSDELLQSLRSGQCDMIVGVASGSIDDLTARLLVEDDMLLIVGTRHPLARAQSCRWRDLEGHEIVHFDGGSIGELAAAALTTHGLAASARFRVDQVESLYGLVGSGLAIGIMPRLYTLAVQGLEYLKLVRLIAPEVTRKVMLMHRRELATEHALAAEFADRLATALATAEQPPHGRA